MLREESGEGCDLELQRCVPGGWENKERTTGHKLAIQYVVRMLQ